MPEGVDYRYLIKTIEVNIYHKIYLFYVLYWAFKFTQTVVTQVDVNR